MRLSAAEKYELIQTVTTSEAGVKKTLEVLELLEAAFTNGTGATTNTAMMVNKIDTISLLF